MSSQTEHQTPPALPTRDTASNVENQFTLTGVTPTRDVREDGGAGGGQSSTLAIPPSRTTLDGH